jgi:hypothetical protein
MAACKKFVMCKGTDLCLNCGHGLYEHYQELKIETTQSTDVMAANQRQVGGSHYKTGGEEHWDRVARLGLDYFQGQITKYVERWKRKNGIQDLEKAAHFLQKYIALAKNGSFGEFESSAGEPGAGYVSQEGDGKGLDAK